MNLKQEKVLVLRAQKDPEAFGCLFDEYHQKILGYVLRRIGSVDAAEDITSDIFFKAMKGLWRFRWQNVPFSAWLYRIATNEINCHFRTGRSRRLSLDELIEKGLDIPSTADIEIELINAEAQMQRHRQFIIVQRAVAKMPVKYQEVIALRFFEDKKVREIAEILGKKEGTVKSLISRGMEDLKDSLFNNKHQEETQRFLLSGILDSEG